MNEARPDADRRAGRASLVLASVLVAGGVALAAFALWPNEPDGVVLDVTQATIDRPPETIPPESIPTEPAPTTSAPRGAREPNDTDRVTETTIALSPLADLLGVSGSAIPPAIEPRIRPASVTIDGIDLVGPVRAVGLADDGQLEVPDETEIGWYRYGSSPGREGATVLAAHVTWNSTTGPFFRLGEMEPGERITVGLADDSLRTYEVVERTMYDKDSLPRERIWRTTGDETLVLITCGGAFNPDLNRYRQNIVIYAVPVAATGVR